MRVVFLTHYYPPEVGAPQSRIASVADGLARRGHEVAVHTCAPHYPDGVIAKGHRNALFSRSRVGDVTVVRSLVVPAANRGFAMRVADHASFALSAFATAPLSPAADVVVAESPPLFTAAAAVGYARLKRAALMVNVADRWPESAVQLGMLRNRRAVRAAVRLERGIYRAAAVVSVPTLGLESALNEEPTASGKVVRLLPAVDVDRFDPSWPSAVDGPLRVVYAGTIGLAQGLGTLLDAAALAGPDLVHVRGAGGGADAEALAARAPANVEMLGLVRPEEVPGLYRSADAAVGLLRDRPIFAGALPTKLLEGMAAGRPLVVSARGEAAEFVGGAGAGLVVAPENPEELAQAFETLHRSRSTAEQMGMAGRAYVESHHSREASLDQWHAAIELALSRRTGRG